LILTLDLGTSTTKATVWDDDGPAGRGQAPVVTTFPAPDRAEQDPAAWWDSVLSACAAARASSASAAAAFAAVEAVGFAAARQTFVPVTAAGDPLGPALVWSDRRAVMQARRLAQRFGGPAAARRRSGLPLDGASPAAKVLWLADHDPDRLAAARHLLSPRDHVVRLLTGAVVTDRTLASAAGFLDPDGAVLAELDDVLGDRLPPVLAPDAVAGPLTAAAADALGLAAGLPVVVGAGDRACEVLGTAASPQRPLVSFGTTANVSVPLSAPPAVGDGGDGGDGGAGVGDALIVTRAAPDGFLLEGGLSGAGSLLVWLAGLTGSDPPALLAAAATAPPGAHGLVALPWFGGARAPWWRDAARGAFVGLGSSHDAADMARALVEAVAFEVRRCLAAVSRAGLGPPSSLALTGDPAALGPWSSVVCAVTGLPGVRRRLGLAASAGAAILTAAAVGKPLELDRLDPVADTVTPDAAAVAAYAGLAPRLDAVAAAVIGLDAVPPEPAEPAL